MYRTSYPQGSPLSYYGTGECCQPPSTLVSMMRERRWCLITGVILSAICLGLLLLGSDRRVLLLARNTLWLSLGALLLSLPLGTLVAFLLARSDLPFKRTAWLLLVMLLFLPLYLQAAAWRAGFGQQGWYALVPMSAEATAVRSWGAAIWIHSVWSLPWVALIVAGVLRMCEPELEEEALLDASASRVFWSVTLRRSLPGIVVAGVWVVLITAGEMTVTDLYQIRTLAEELYTGFALSIDDTPSFGFGTAMLFTGFLCGLALVALDVLVVTTAHVPTRPPFCFRLRRWRVPLTVLIALLLLVLVGVPLSSLFYQVGIEVRQVDGQPVRDWTWSQASELLIPLPGTYRYSAIYQFADELLWTLLIGVTSATIVLVIALLLAWWARPGRWRLMPAALVAAIGLATLGPLVGLVVSKLFTSSDHPVLFWLGDRTIAPPVLAASIRALPLPILICFVAFRTLSGEVLDAAALDGAGPLRRIWSIGVRQRSLVFVVAWLVAFAIACGELSATIMVNPAGITTVAIRVFRLLHTGVRNQVAAVCLTSMLGFLLVAALVTSLAPRLWRSGARHREPCE